MRNKEITSHYELHVEVLRGQSLKFNVLYFSSMFDIFLRSIPRHFVGQETYRTYRAVTRMISCMKFKNCKMHDTNTRYDGINQIGHLCNMSFLARRVVVVDTLVWLACSAVGRRLTRFVPQPLKQSSDRAARISQSDLLPDVARLLYKRIQS